MSNRGKRYTQESAGSGSYSSSDRICYCGLQAPIQVSKSEANPGREYYSCPTGRCRWFMWAETAMKCSGRLGAQTRKRDAEESQVGSGNSLLLQERVRKLENECVTLKMLVCMNLFGFLFCMFLLIALLSK
ncbi:hypothetical protein PIB30_084461 [Stylosanthes scabra]|uniref:GRF-type domain-containing protein n=1 Tax=Stylosanthes scabra TaxID=79078 RepID=A0ABU6VSY9_9FABA|nr:hypothetical protein [Stylosanthes scabra]